MTTIVVAPYSFIADLEGGPLEGGHIYIGISGLNPVIEANRLAIFSDAAFTVPVAQPVRTEAGIAIGTNGSPIQVYTSSAEYSIVITDSNGALVWSNLNVSTVSGSLSVLDNYSVDTGAANAYIAAGATSVSAYQAGLTVSLKIANANTAASTLNYMGLGIRNIILQTGNALVGGELQAGGIYKFEYDGASFQLMGLDVQPPQIRTAAEVAAAVTPSNIFYLADDVRRYGAVCDNVTLDDTPFTRGVSVASQTIAGAVGAPVILPLGTLVLSSQKTLPNNVRLSGTNKNGSILRASGTWNSGTSPYMLNAINGASSMFDSLLEDLTIDCNNIAGLSGILSDAWQENCGPRRCLIYQFRTYGIRYQNGFGGAAFSTIEDCEFFGSAAAAATAGIKVEQISSAGTFILNIKRTTISGAPGALLPRCIDIVNDSSSMDTIHFENAVTGLYLDGNGTHKICNLTGDGTVTNVVEIAATFRGTVTFLACRRGSATNLIKDNRVGGLGNIVEDISALVIGAGSAQAISGITQAAAAVVTVSTASVTNPFVVGNQLTFTSVLGMTQINGLRGTVTAIGGVSGAWTATVNINSGAFTAYLSGGVATLPISRAVSAPNAAIAWCIFDGTVAGTNAPTAGFNVKSILRNAAGDYTVNFTNILINASASLTVSTNLDTADGWWFSDQGFGLGNANFTIRRGGAFAGGKVDASRITMIVFGLGT